MIERAATEVSLEAPHEIVTTRLLDAPRDRVFDAFTRAEQVAAWWSPAGFSLRTQEMDVRAGGTWRYTVRGPDGKDYPNRVVYLVVDPPSRLVYANDDDRDGPPWFHVTVSFEPRGERTWLQMRAIFPTTGARNEVIRDFAAVEVARQTVDRLAAALVALPHPRDVVISQELGVPPERAWQAWADAAQLARWWGPPGTSCPQCEIDLRPGGAHRIVVRTADGTNYPAHGRIVELEAPERLLMTMDCSEHPTAWHDSIRPGRAAEDVNPAGVMWLGATFEPLPQGRTRLTLRIRFESAEIRDTMVAMGLVEAWAASLGRLAEVVAA